MVTEPELDYRYLGFREIPHICIKYALIPHDFKNFLRHFFRIDIRLEWGGTARTATAGLGSKG